MKTKKKTKIHKLDKALGLTPVASSGSKRPRVRCGVCGEKRFLFFTQCDENWEHPEDDGDFCYDCGKKQIAEDMKLLRKARAKERKERKERARQEAEEAQREHARARVRSKEQEAKTTAQAEEQAKRAKLRKRSKMLASEGNIPLMIRLLRQNKTDEEIERTFKTLYHGQGKTSEKWIQARIRTYKRIAKEKLDD